MNDNVNVTTTAETPVVQTAPAAPQSPVVRIQLTLDEVNIILGGLGELPAKTSLGVIEKVRTQTISQLQQLQQVQDAPAA